MANETHDSMNKRIDEIQVVANDALDTSNLALRHAQVVNGLVINNTKAIEALRTENSAQHNQVQNRVDSVYDILVNQRDTRTRLKLAKKHWLITTCIGLLAIGGTYFFS